MYRYNKILVGLDNTETDIDLIRATSRVSKHSGSQMVCFMNVIRDFSMPEELLKEFPQLLEKAIEERKAELEKKIAQHFEEQPDVTIEVIVKRGHLTRNLLKFTAREKVDLVVLGRKNEKNNGGITLNRIARRVGCSLLIIPKGVKLSLDKILVPTDFSDYSKLAMEKAVALAGSVSNKAKIIIQNVYQVPVGYHYTGKSFEEFADIMKEHAKNDYERFIGEFDLNGLEIDQTYSLDNDEDITTDIYRIAKEKEVNLIIIGAKGRTAATAIFIGSKAERVVQVDSEIPTLVVRPKGKNAGFLEYIKEL